MKAAKLFSAGQPKEQGVAIIVVLSFVVLLSGLVVAFFSRALIDQQVSMANTNQTKAEILAGSATDIILANLKREIVLGSEVDSGVYFPRTSLDAQPRKTDVAALINASTGISAIPNLIRRSKFGSHLANVDALPVADVASNAPTWSGATYRKRQITPDRWNAHFLMPLSANSAATAAALKISAPTSAFNSVIPDWIYLNGGNQLGPVIVGADSTSEVSGTAKIVGRYAYMMYDVGGLLDANIVGYPTAVSGSSTLEQYSRKQSLGYADLTMIPSGVTGVTGSLTGPNQINPLVAWRNKVTSGASDGGVAFSNTNDYHEYLTNPAVNNNFLAVRRTNQTGAAALSDQAFVNRSTLIKAWANQINVTGTSVGMTMPALQYFTSFSRDLNQPSLAPDPNRPIVVTGTGNTADNVINPKFLTVTVTSGSRNDGTAMVPGEPLVKSRFPLNKLALLNPDNTDPQKVDKIRSYFGLSSDGQTWEWEYRPVGSAGVADRILTLREVAGEGREPNFFELLKASITVGALGQVSYTPPGATDYERAQYLRDSSVDYHIIQIGANIIDQYDADSYPTRIHFGAAGSSSNLPKNLYGIENIPYLYRLRNSVVKVQTASIANTGTAATLPAPTVSSTIAANGMGVMFLQPEVWNPHQSSPAVAGASYPVAFRFSVDTGGADITVTSETSQDPAPLSGILSSTLAVTGSANPQFHNDFVPVPVVPSFSNNGLTFSGSNSTQFREPVILGRKDRPSGSGLVSDVNGLMNYIPGSVLQGTEMDRYVTSVQVPVSGVTQNVGVYMGLAPLAWITNVSGTNYAVAAQKFVATVSSGSAVTCRLQFSDGTNWYDYDEKIVPLSVFKSQIIHSGSSSYGVIGTDTWGSVIDPRTGRFGMPAGLSTTPISATFLNSGTNLVTMQTNRPNTAVGQQIGGPDVQGLPTSNKWVAPNFTFGLFSENRHGASAYYADSDFVVRRASGGFAGANVSALPEATASAARPVILNRPFVSVAELGYVFSGIPWRNLDMSSPESGFAGLLDVFTVDESMNNDSLVAGRVNLNTRQLPVLSSLLRNANQDVVTPASVITAANANSMAGRGVSYTGAADSSINPVVFGTNSLRNLGEIVGKWDEANAPVAANTIINGSALYKSLGNDISLVLAVADNGRINERFRATPARVLSNVGTTRVWNLMIDVIAQSGRMSSYLNAHDDFIVTGEVRYWVHVAIDRYTGKIIDKRIELVQE